MALGAVNGLRAPVRRDEILLVTGNASAEKIADVEKRLHFLFFHLGIEPKVHRVTHASAWEITRSARVVTVESDAIPGVLRRTDWCFDFDFDNNFAAEWGRIQLGTSLAKDAVEKSISTGRRRFTARVQEIRARGPRPAYLFGTGPSLRLAAERSFDDGITVVCNTTVRDPDLFHHLKPTFYAAGDPMYFFSETEHAQAFRADALARLEESDGHTLFLYPAESDVLVRSEFRSVDELLVAIPWGTGSDVAVDLTTDYGLPHIDNVLNAMLLPIGCTVSHDVRLWGFDGRAPNDSGFWSYSPKTAYPELIPTVKEAYPAFFRERLPTGKEFSYVQKYHVDWLEPRLADAERRGFSFRMMHPSWTKTLQKRYVPDGDETATPGESRD